MGTAISVELEQQIGEALRGGMGAREAARHFGVSRGTVDRIANGRPARRALPVDERVRPHHVPWFDCPTCRVASHLKWDRGDEICFACHIRAEVEREQAAGVA